MYPKDPINKKEYFFIRNNVKNISDVKLFIQILDAFRSGLFHYTESITEERIKTIVKSKASDLYRDIKIPKKAGGYRTISIPNMELKVIQDCITAFFKFRKYSSQPGIGYALKRVPVSNNPFEIDQVHFETKFVYYTGGINVAVAHTDADIVYNFDISDFFGSITSEQIILTLTKKTSKHSYIKGNLSLNYKVAKLISILVTKPNEEGGRILPQGAPSSPIISEIIASRLDVRLIGFCKKHGVNYSRYVDDISFSCSKDKPWYIYRSFFEKIIETEGFKVNAKKCKVSFNYQRQIVTGVVVNKKMNLPQKYIKELRTIIHNWELDGYVVANNKFIYNYMQKHNFNNSKMPPRIEHVVSGKLSYLKMIRGADGLWTKLHERYKSLRIRDYCIITGKNLHKNNHKYYRYGDDIGPFVHAIRDNESAPWRIIEVQNYKGEWIKADEDYAYRLRYPEDYN